MNPLDEFDLDITDNNEIISNNPLLDPPKKEKKETILLSKEQELIILTEWEKRPENPPSIPELIRLVWPDIEENLIDARTTYGKIIREYLIAKFGPEVTQIKKKELELTPEHQEYIRNNCSNMSAFEMSKELFQNPRLSPAAMETRLVKEFLKTLPGAMVNEEEEELDVEYRPPKKLEHALARIIKYVKDCKIDRNKLTPSQKKQAEALIGYLHDYRLIHQINTYENIDDKKLFESSFISYTWDKSDLSAEDVHQYIILCTEVVMSASIQRTINMLQSEQDRQMEEGEGKLSMSLIEAVNVARTEYNSSVKRQETLFKALVTQRSQRLNDRIGPQFTLLSIVEEMKNEEKRKSLIQDAEKRNDKIKGEIKKLSSMDERIVRIWGIDQDLILNG